MILYIIRQTGFDDEYKLGKFEVIETNKTYVVQNTPIIGDIRSTPPLGRVILNKSKDMYANLRCTGYEMVGQDKNTLIEKWNTYMHKVLLNTENEHALALKEIRKAMSFDNKE